MKGVISLQENIRLSGRHKQYCEGYYSTEFDEYVLGVNFSVSKVKKDFSHDGSMILDQTNAFDTAEIAESNLGQINMITVSSFCGPQGKIWGYDICAVDKEKIIWEKERKRFGFSNIKVYSIEPLMVAFKRLTGTINKKRFPFMPGSFVPCAKKSTVQQGECILYAAQGLGVPVKRDQAACVLMEDFGTIPLLISDKAGYEKEIEKNLVRSIQQIGKNQGVDYSEVFVGLRSLKIDADEIGCALTADPYFKLAQLAFPKSIDLASISLSDWEHKVMGSFIHNR